MQIAGRNAVVTGAGGGIGRALAQALRARGAAQIACCDINAESAAQTAQLCDGLGFALDVTDRAATEALIAEFETQHGPVDLFFANAGILQPGGTALAPEHWQASWDVNVMGHVHGASVMVPRWQTRGHGYFIATASAAGMLGQIGSAPYSVTKHAALGFAEWLHFTHRDDGIGVSALCPQAVETAMIAGNEDGVASLDGTLSASDVATITLDAVEAGQFLILPHPQVADYEALRATDRERWLAGMAKLNRRFGA